MLDRVQIIEWLAECNEIHIDFRVFVDNIVRNRRRYERTKLA
jgi:hypothetical protein